MLSISVTGKFSELLRTLTEALGICLQLDTTILQRNADEIFGYLQVCVIMNSSNHHAPGHIRYFNLLLTASSYYLSRACGACLNHHNDPPLPQPCHLAPSFLKCIHFVEFDDCRAKDCHQLRPPAVHHFVFQAQVASYALSIVDSVHGFIHWPGEHFGPWLF